MQANDTASFVLWAPPSLSLSSTLCCLFLSPACTSTWTLECQERMKERKGGMKSERDDKTIEPRTMNGHAKRGKGWRASIPEKGKKNPKQIADREMWPKSSCFPRIVFLSSLLLSLFSWFSHRDKANLLLEFIYIPLGRGLLYFPSQRNATALSLSALGQTAICQNANIRFGQREPLLEWHAYLMSCRLPFWTEMAKKKKKPKIAGAPKMQQAKANKGNQHRRAARWAGNESRLPKKR